MIILHGEDTPTSYQRLTQIIDSYRTRSIEISILEANELDIPQLRQLTAGDLFGSTCLLVIKNLFAGPKSKNKEILLEGLSDLQEADIVIYETKNVAVTLLKPFSKSKIESFALNPVIFKFLDFIRPQYTSNLLQGWNRLVELGLEPEYVFTMIVRQIRLLIQAKSGPSYLKLAPYPKKLVQNQSNYFQLSHLLELHQKLFEIDKKIKTGTTTLNLSVLLLQFFLSI